MPTLQALKPLIVRPSLLPFLLLAIGLSAGGALAQQPSTVGANLFAPSPQLGKTVDAERALPITSFYTHIELKSGAKPGTLVRSEPATDYDLPPGVTATRILYYTRTASGKDALASGVSCCRTADLRRAGGRFLPGHMAQAESPEVALPRS